MNDINYKEWFNKNAKVYSNSMNKHTILHRAKFIKKHVQGKVLDIGIGDGHVASLYINSKRIKEVIGLDFSKEMLNECRKKLKIKCICGDIEALNFKENSFDTIVCSEVIYYLSSPRKFIEKCKKILKRNGKLIIILHNPRTFFLEPILVMLKLTPKEDIQSIIPLEIESLFHKEDFRDINIKKFCVIPMKGFKFVDKLFLNKFGFKVGIVATKL